MKITFLAHDLVSTRLLLHSSNIHVKYRAIIFMRSQVFFPVFPHIFLPCFVSYQTITEPIFLDINHICTDLSVRSRHRVTGPGNKFTSSIARMLLNFLNLCKILMVQNRLLFFFLFFRRMFLDGLTIYCICCWICLHTCKTYNSW